MKPTEAFVLDDPRAKFNSSERKALFLTDPPEMVTGIPAGAPTYVRLHCWVNGQPHLATG